MRVYCFKGIDKDKFLTRITKAYMAIMGNGKENIFCENSLDSPKNWSQNTQISILLGTFDILFTNPPFGAKIKIKGDQILSQFDLGYKWLNENGEIKRSNKIRSNQAPQILFIERCLQFLKEGGKMAIVLPEGLLGNPTQEYIRKFILDNSKVLAVIDAPIETFLPNTGTKTCILFLKKGLYKNIDYKIFMAIAEKCGHDSRDNIIFKINQKGDYIYDKAGKRIVDDNFPLISENFRKVKYKKSTEFDTKGFLISLTELRSRSLIPRFYDPTIKGDIVKLKDKYNLIQIEELVQNGVLTILNGQGIKKKYYGTGDIPYIRTSDISNWELKINPSYSVSEEIYNRFKQELKIDDILFVMDGGRLIGNTCILSEEEDIRCLIQSHFQIFRCEKKKQLDPFLLLYLLNTPVAKKQVRANIVVQSTLATIGERTKDIFLPIPKDPTLKEEIINTTKRIIKERAKLRKEIGDISTHSLL